MNTPNSKAQLKAALLAMAAEAKAGHTSLELALVDAFDELEVELKGQGRFVRRMVLVAPIPEAE